MTIHLVAIRNSLLTNRLTRRHTFTMLRYGNNYAS
jgi:hypothetical protein